MADKCAGCMSKFKFREKPRLCPECHREFCHVCIPGKKGDKKSSKTHSSPAAEHKRITCVYCTRTLKQVKEAEEAEILENFEERFHKQAHVAPPIRTKVQLDYTKMAPKGTAAPKLPDEYQALEERVRRLKESQKKASPQSTDAEMKDRLEKLWGDRDNSKTSSGAGDPSAREKQEGTPFLEGGGAPETRFDQTQDLLERAAAEVKLDERLEETSAKRDDNLQRRFLALKGKKGGGEGGDAMSAAGPRTKPDLEIEHFLKEIDIQVPDEEDPEKLLEDLKAMQSKYRQSAMREAESRDIQEIVAAARELGSQERGGGGGGGDAPLITPYPKLPETEDPPVEDPEHKIAHSEVSKVMQLAALEMEEDEVREKETRSYVEAASDRLTKLRNRGGESCTVGGSVAREGGEDEEPDCIVKSKATAKQLDFSWGHFGSMLDSDAQSTSVAQQLGITFSGDFTPREGEGGGWGGGGGEGGGASGYEDLDDSVSKLLDQMLAEAALDKKLEASGYDSYLRDEEHSDRKSEETSGAGPPPDSRPSGASAAARPTWGGGGEEPDLPWCCICNCDATLRCFDCDGDLYCTRCFSEGHQQFGLFDHQYLPYKAEK